MAVVAKKDIDILTKQLLHSKIEILEVLISEHAKVDSSLKHEIFFPKFEEKYNKINEPNSMPTILETDTIALDDMEQILRRFDVLDKNINETATVVRKETHNIKRFGSKNDINKTMLRSLSSVNLNTTKVFAEPQAPAFRTNINCSIACGSNEANSESFVTPTVSSKLLFKHNKIKEELQTQLNSTKYDVNNYSLTLHDIEQKYKTSSDRLDYFITEVHQIESNKSTEIQQIISLKELNNDLINSMDKLSQAMIQMKFISKNKHLYNSDNIKEIDSSSSDELTDILEQFYRTTS